MRSIFFLLVSLSACPISPEEVKAEESATTEWCAKVTEENWHLSSWERAGKTSQEVCRDSYMLYNPGDRPCTFGGLPALCNTSPEGVMNIRLMNSGSPLTIFPDDVHRVTPYLVIH